jgi:hypothetical protein
MAIRWPGVQGPQFEQTAIPTSNAVPSEQTGLRARYHMTRDTPLHLQTYYNPGARYISHPSPTPAGMEHAVTTIGSHRDDELIVHPEERDNYPVPEGQMVMGPPHNPQQFGVVDGHGNVNDSSIGARWFRQHGPQMNDENEEFWDRHAKFQKISTSAVLHTGQTAYETGSHSYVTGPLAPDHPHVKVVVQNGTSLIADGHHRLAEARGRGDSHVGAQVLNLDQFQAEQMPKIKKKTPAEDIVDHLVKYHGYSPTLSHSGAFDEHAYAHREGLHEHDHG